MAQRNGLLTFAIGPQRNHNCHSCRRRRTNAAHALLLLQQWRQRERNIITTCWCCCCGLVQSSSMRYVHYNKLSSSSSNFNDVAGPWNAHILLPLLVMPVKRPPTTVYYYTQKEELFPLLRIITVEKGFITHEKHARTKKVFTSAQKKVHLTFGGEIHSVFL